MNNIGPLNAAVQDIAAAANIAWRNVLACSSHPQCVQGFKSQR